MALGVFRPHSFLERGSRLKTALDHLPISHLHGRRLAAGPAGNRRGRQRLYLTRARSPRLEEKDCHLTTLQPSSPGAKPLWFGLIPFSLPLLWLMHKGLGVAKSAAVLVWRGIQSVNGSCTSGFPLASSSKDEANFFFCHFETHSWLGGQDK